MKKFKEWICGFGDISELLTPLSVVRCLFKKKDKGLSIDIYLFGFRIFGYTVYIFDEDDEEKDNN